MLENLNDHFERVRNLNKRVNVSSPVTISSCRMTTSTSSCCFDCSFIFSPSYNVSLCSAKKGKSLLYIPAAEGQKQKQMHRTNYSRFFNTDLMHLAVSKTNKRTEICIVHQAQWHDRVLLMAVTITQYTIRVSHLKLKVRIRGMKFVPFIHESCKICIQQFFI